MTKINSAMLPLQVGIDNIRSIRKSNIRQAEGLVRQEPIQFFFPLWHVHLYSQSVLDLAIVALIL